MKDIKKCIQLLKSPQKELVSDLLRYLDEFGDQFQQATQNNTLEVVKPPEVVPPLQLSKITSETKIQDNPSQTKRNTLVQQFASNIKLLQEQTSYKRKVLNEFITQFQEENKKLDEPLLKQISSNSQNSRVLKLNASTTPIQKVS